MFNKNITIVAVYGPNEDERINVKHNFWNELQMIVDKLDTECWIKGDLNARVGNWLNNVMGPFGEETRNKNGHFIIDFCLVNGLVTSNSFYKHKNIHKYTRVGKNGTEKSIIDFLLLPRSFRNRLLGST